MAENIVEWWRHFWDHADFWDAFWPSVWGALVGAGSAFALERRDRRNEQKAREIAECNRLMFTLIRMLSTLEDYEEQLFTLRKQRLKRDPEWNEIGALVGVTLRRPEFLLGEYTFLLEGKKAVATAEALNSIYVAEANFQAIVERLIERNQLWNEHCAYRAQRQYTRGEHGLNEVGAEKLLEARIKELTVWLKEDLPESIGIFRKLLPKLHIALALRYPKQTFLSFQPLPKPKE